MTGKTVKTDIFVILGSALLLVPVIFFPVTTDLAVFIQAGEKIAGGGKPYVDFIDIKPPAIYYIYAFIYTVFGKSEPALRFFDFIIQLFTVTGLYYLLKNNLSSKFTAIAAALVYAISYTTLAHNQTAQVESFIPLLSVSMIYFAIKRPEKKVNIILVGTLAGIITALKTSMGFVVFLIPLTDYLLNDKDLKMIASRFLLVLYGFLPVLLLAALPFFDGEIRNGFANVLAYWKFYAQFPPLETAFIRDTIKQVGIFFGDKFSLLFSLLLFFGLFKTLKNSKAEIGKNTYQFFAFALAMLILLSLSILIERKFFFYHYVRLYALFAIFISIGAEQLFNDAKRVISLNKKFTLALILVALFFIVMSPLPRFVSLLVPTANYFLDKDKYNEYYTRYYAGGVVLRKEQMQTANYILRNSSGNDKVLVVSVASSILNYYLGDLALNKFALSCFYISDPGIPQWRKDALEQLKRSNRLVLQENDINYMANRHYITSRRYFLSNMPYKKYVKEHFRLDTTIGDFYIYKKTNKKE